MGDPTEFFIRFHNLEGDLVGKRKKSLFKLISNPSLFQNEQQRNEALDKLEPKTYQETIFYLDALIYFKRTEKLFEILKGGNQLFATKILNQPWFFELAFKDMDVNELVNDVMQYFSFVVRKKLVKRLSKCWSEEKIDDLFDALSDKYGITASVSILPKCTVGKIKSILEENDIKLGPNQVIELFEKNEDILKLYLTYYKTMEDSVYSEKKVGQYLGLKNPKLLLELEKDEILHLCSVGRRITKKIMKISKDVVLKNCERYLQFLNKPAMVQKLGSEFEVVFKKTFPQSFLELPNFCINYDYIKYYPKNRRWQLFVKACNEHFINKSEKDILMALDPNIIKLKPPQNTLYKWAAVKYEKGEIDYEDYLQYYPSSEAIEIVKEKINLTSDTRRKIYLLNLLIKMCAMNQDAASLEVILEYICTRHKKETSVTRDLLEIIRNTYKVGNLNENHWKYIYDLWYVLKIYKDSEYHWNDDLDAYYLKFMVENGIAIEQVFIDYFKQLLEDDHFNELHLGNADVEREIYIRFCKVISKAVAEKPREAAVHNFICLLVKFSISNLGHCINLKEFPEIVYAVDTVFTKDTFESSELELIPRVIMYNDIFPHYAFSISSSTLLNIFALGINQQSHMWPFNEVFSKIVNKKNRTDFANDLLHFYLNTLYKEYPDSTLIDWLLKNEPRSLIPYYDIVLENNIIEEYGTFLDNKFLKQYSHLDLDRRLKNYFIKKLDETSKNDTNTINKCIARSYSIFTPEEIIKLVEDKFLPKNDKLDLEDEEMRDLYNIQLNIAKILGKVDEPYKMLPTIMKFAKGDYLQSTLPALYSAFYKSPEKILYSYVEQLSKQAVSARKHAIFLSCAVLDKEYTKDLLINTSQTNTSSQKHMFSSTLKYFLKNPSQDLLEKVIDSLSTIDKSDIETLEKLKTVTVPKKYRSQYVEKCWYFYEGLEISHVKIDGYLETFLEYMSGNIVTALSDKFTTYVIQKYFVKKINGIETFIIQVLRDRSSDRIKNCNLIFELLSNSSSDSVDKFFQTFIDIVSQNKVDDKSFLCLFSEYWYKHFTITKQLRSHISLKLLLLHTESNCIQSYAHAVVDYMDELMTQMTALVFPVFREQLLVVLLTFNQVDKFRFLLSILNYRTDADTCILVMQLVSCVHKDDFKEIRSIYTNIMDIIKDIDIPIVVAYYKIHLVSSNME